MCPTQEHLNIYVKQILIDLMGETDGNIIGDFNTPVTLMDR